MTYGATARKLRARFDVSRSELAAEIGMSTRWVDMVERDAINVNPSMASRITRSLIAAHKKKAPGYSAASTADQEPSQTETNRQEGTDPMTIILHEGPDTAQSLVVVPCEHPGCDNYETGHEVDVYDRTAMSHRHAGTWEQSAGHVDVYWDVDLGRWHVGASLNDNDGPLSWYDVHAFTIAWDRAYAAAQELNTLEVPC